MLDKESHCCTGQGNAQNKKVSVINISFYGHNTRLCVQHLPALKLESTIAACRFVLLKQLDYEPRLPRDCTIAWALSYRSFVGESADEAIRVYNISRGLSRTATTWDEISGSHPRRIVCLLDSPCGP